MQTFDDRRRRFVTHLVLAGAGAAIVGGWSTGCAPGGPSADEVAREAKSYDPDLDCTDTSDLYEAQKSIREENEYVAVSNHPTQRCFNCTFYQPAEQRSSCGTCETVPGPIHPLGRCKAWVYRR